MPQPQSRMSGRRSAGGAGDQRFDEPAEAAEPEVIALGARGGLEKTIHRDKLERVNSTLCAQES